MINFVKKHLRALLWAGGLVLLVGVGLELFYLSYKPTRAAQLTEQAQLELANGDALGAQLIAQRVLALDSKSLPGLRILAQAQQQLAPQQGVETWQQIVQRSGQRQDQLALAGAYLNAGDLEKTQQWVSQLQQEIPNDAHLRLLDLSLQYAYGRKMLALEKVIALSADYPEMLAVWFRYGEIVRQINLPEVTADFKKALLPLADRKDGLGFWAQAQLATLADKEDFISCADRVLNNPLCSRQMRLNLLLVSREKLGVSSAEIARSARRYFNLALNSEQKAYASFLLSLGNYRDLLELITPKRAVVDIDFMSLYLQGLEGEGKWQAILELVSNPKLPIAIKDRYQMKAQAYFMLGDLTQAQHAWNALLEKFSGNYLALFESANYALNQEHFFWAQETFPKLIEASDKFNYAPYLMWMQMCLTQKNTPALLRVLAEMQESFSENLYVKESVIYYNALLGNSGNWVKQAYDLTLQAPSVPSCRITLALALLKKGQAQKALESIQSAQIRDWHLVDPAWQFVRAAVLRANGQPSDDLGKLEDKVLPEERALLNPTTKALEIQGPVDSSELDTDIN